MSKYVDIIKIETKYDNISIMSDNVFWFEVLEYDDDGFYTEKFNECLREAMEFYNASKYKRKELLQVWEDPDRDDEIIKSLDPVCI